MLIEAESVLQIQDYAVFGSLGLAGVCAVVGLITKRWKWFAGTGLFFLAVYPAILLPDAFHSPRQVFVVGTAAEADDMTMTRYYLTNPTTYRLSDGRSVEVADPGEGFCVLAINNSNRPMRVVSVTYSVGGNIPGDSGGEQQILPPFSAVPLKECVDFFGTGALGASASVKSTSPVMTRFGLLWDEPQRP